MTSRAVGVRRLGGLLELTLDTPSCDVNIVGVEAAAEIVEVFASTDPATVSAVLLRSGKRRSFVNGARLMMAGAARTGDDARRLSEPIRRAYRALRDYPVPTVAAIRGNCYGCGMELALHCDYRVAADTEATHFHMTEIADYLLVPAFGGTQDLPRLLGLDLAARLLLWGERWHAPEAADHGLVDAWFEDGVFDSAVLQFAEEVAARGGKRPPGSGKRSGTAPAVDAAHRARIAQLPPTLQPLYRTGYELMQSSLARAPGDREGYARELEACGQTAVEPMAKKALSFFFVRQIALLTATRNVTLGPETRVIVAPGKDARLAAWAADLSRRKIEGVTFEQGSSDADAAPGTIFLVPPKTGPAGAIGAMLDWLVDLPQREQPILYAPLLDAGIRLVEIVASRHLQPALGRMVAVLDRAGYSAVLTYELGYSLINAMIAAVAAPLVTYVCGGGSAADAHATLRAFGFVRPVSALFVSMSEIRRLGILRENVPWEWSNEAIVAAVEKLVTTTFEGGEAEANLGEAVEASLLELATRAREDGFAPHPTTIDLVAREVVDFPLRHGSLCRYLSASRAAELVARRSRFVHLLADEEAPASTRMAHDRRSFYRRRSARKPVAEGAKVG